MSVLCLWAVCSHEQNAHTEKRFHNRNIPGAEDAPALGQFLSPDTLVPDAGLVLDYNRRCRCFVVKGRPARGQFLSPDTLVPDAGLVLDDNRYMYVRGNPLNYTDPTGHCAVLGNGSPDTENDRGCWDAAKEWYGTFGGGDYQSEEEWLRYFASQPNITEDVLRARLSAHWSPIFRSSGVYHHRYNPRPTDGFVDGPKHPIELHGAALRDVLSGRCELVDCTGLIIDSVGLASTIVAAGGSAFCGPAAPGCAAALKIGGTSIGAVATIGGFGRVVVRASNGTASGTDVTMTVVTSALSITPVAPVSGAAQIIYDVFGSPFTTPTPY